MPYGLKELGQQITMKPGQKPRIGLGKKVYNSVQEALKNNGDRYRGPDGKVRQLHLQKVPGVEDTYQLKSKPQKLTPAFKKKGNRGEASRASTAKDVDIKKSETKGGDITRKGKQHHHLVSLRYYQPYFDALDDAGKVELTRLLNEKKIYPGDDRRNYVALMGSNQAIGSDHQGKVHPIMDRLRAQDELKPDLARLRGMTAQQLFQEMLPRIRRDQQVVRDVLLHGRTNIMTADPELEQALQTPPQEKIQLPTTTPSAPKDVVEPLEGIATDAQIPQTPAVTPRDDSLQQPPIQQFGQQLMDMSAANVMEKGMLIRKAGGIFFQAASTLRALSEMP